MKPRMALFAIACVLLGGCGKKDTAQKNLLTNNSSGNPITAPVDYLGAVNQGRKFAIKKIDLVQVQNAINFFNANEDHFPRSLDEVVAKHYLGSLPELPPGSRYAYNPQNGEVKVVQQQ